MRKFIGIFESMRIVRPDLSEERISVVRVFEDHHPERRKETTGSFK